MNTEKQRSEQKRVYIVTKDAQTGKLIPNKNIMISMAEGQVINKQTNHRSH
jgi:pyruvate/2-oxoacid:ferredoxin oxidoreductase beta subunit